MPHTAKEKASYAAGVKHGIKLASKKIAKRKKK